MGASGLEAGVHVFFALLSALTAAVLLGLLYRGESPSWTGQAIEHTSCTLYLGFVDNCGSCLCE